MKPSHLLTAFAFLACAAGFSAPAAAATRAEAEAACTPDAMRLCSQQIPDEAKVRSCLIKNRKQLSAACGEIFKAGSGGKKRSKGKRKRRG